VLLPRAKEIYQPITSAGFAAAGSVIDHRFGKGDAYTLGVEEEYMLRDPERSSRTRGISAASANSRGSTKSSLAATAPTGNCRSSTPTKTWSRSRGRSQQSRWTA
jgi:hypothetical protein